MTRMITSIEFHRNGIAGEPFYVAQVQCDKKTLVAIVTGQKGSCFVVHPVNLNEGFRGDDLEPMIRRGIVEWYARKYKIDVAAARIELNDGLTESVW